MVEGGFDAVIGNPPYVELHKVSDYEPRADIYSTAACGNLYAPMLERALALSQSNGQGRVGQIVPISCVSTPRMQALRQCWRRFNTRTWLSHYSGDAHPSILFNGVKFRLSIVIQQVHGDPDAGYHTTPFQRWLPDARVHLFNQLEYTKLASSIERGGLFPKINAKGSGILTQLAATNVLVARSVDSESPHTAFAHRIVAHYVKAFDFMPFFRSERDGEKRSEDYKIFAFRTRPELEAFTALLNSSLFYFWFVAYSDVYHCGRELILEFPCDIQELSKSPELLQATAELMRAYRATAVRRTIRYQATGLVEYDEFYSRDVKRQIDCVDKVLVKLFEMSDDQLDFILNFDVKYRSSPRQTADA